jgi:transposase InsO family protein
MRGSLDHDSHRAQPGRRFSNHREVLTAMDFFIVPTVTFRLLYVLLVIQHDRRKVLHVNVTAHPTAVWVIQQLREAFPFETAARLLLLDRDSIFSTEVCDALRRIGVQPVRTADQSPWQNGVAERWIGTCRRELLDHVIVLNEEHLRRLLQEFLAYYHADRTHLSLGKDPPSRRAVDSQPSPTARVLSLPRVGGLHHRYEWAEAA